MKPIILVAVLLCVAPALHAGPPTEPKPTKADLGGLFKDVNKIAGGGKYAFSFLGPRFKTLDDYKATARAKVFDLLLYRPDKVDPKPEVLERVDCGAYVREIILFSTTPEFRVPAYVLIPKKAKRPLPAIIDLHSHGGMFVFGKEKVIDLGENHPAMVEYHKNNYDGRPTATELVRRGFLVITIDAFYFGERRLQLDADLKLGLDRSKFTIDDVKHLNQQSRAKEQTLVKGLAFAGVTWPGIVFWDDIRTVDYLLTRDDVDPERLGCLGISMGGYRAMFLAALDERIKAACVVGFMSTVEPMIQSHLDTHSHVHFLPGLHRYLDWPDVAALHAPKPLLVQQCAQDRLFPPEAMRKAVEQIGAAYEKAGARAEFSGRFYEAPHRFTLQMQEEAFEWLAGKLK